MSGGVLAAYIAAGGGLLAALVTAVLSRRPSRLDVLQASLDTRGEDLDRLEARCSSQEARITTLEADVTTCHAERDADRRRFGAELADLRRTIHDLTRGGREEIP